MSCDTISIYETLTATQTQYCACFDFSPSERHLKEFHSHWCMQLHAQVFCYHMLPISTWPNWRFFHKYFIPFMQKLFDEIKAVLPWRWEFSTTSTRCFIMIKMNKNMYPSTQNWSQWNPLSTFLYMTCMLFWSSNNLIIKYYLGLIVLTP